MASLVDSVRPRHLPPSAPSHRRPVGDATRISLCRDVLLVKLLPFIHCQISCVAFLEHLLGMRFERAPTTITTVWSGTSTATTIERSLKVFFREGRFDNAHAYIKQARPHATNDAYLLARASALQAKVWKEQDMFADVKPEASRALDVFEKLGAVGDTAHARWLLQQIYAGNSATLDDG